MANENVFPTIFQGSSWVNAEGGGAGLSKRELFAAMAMQGIFAFCDEALNVAKLSVAAADALLAELAKEKVE